MFQIKLDNKKIRINEQKYKNVFVFLNMLKALVII